MAQGLTLLHSDLIAPSRDLLALWQAADPAPGEVVTDHATAVALMPAFSGYPAVVYEDASGIRHVFPNPSTLEAVTAWREEIDNPAQPPQTRFSQAEFMRLFTQEEFDALLAAEATDADVKRMWAFIRAVGYADMQDSLTVNSLAILRAKNYIPTDERLQEIEAGVAKM
ncbi:hypothetical protein DesfrDRAFT_0044 [Solidesulfovibrio fructosivorans JJ]]|uniref:Uncharacterized protein n=1 Tax=Solidesulfovibrio fructosivorans JJ] TaxID=596151 RepID=E1JQZ5_SOLFR|nr:hypothetical protein [Solidesulfovibrio fructosivorans]EFL52996.1 hypothetical protein DesfrDRAFT_0044 [Solidesulfovibrio fructosivorans JJ]]